MSFRKLQRKKMSENFHGESKTCTYEGDIAY